MTSPPPLQALILAAGRGTRLGSSAGGPKCLLPIAGVPLLDRYLAVLGRLGIPTTIVTGYAAPVIDAHLTRVRRQFQVTCRTVVNPAFTSGSIVSLACGLQAVEGPLLLLDGDVCFAPPVLERLIASPRANALLVDIGTDFSDEEYMTGIVDGRVRALRRGPVPEYATRGEWVGFARLDSEAVAALRRAITAQIDAGATQGGYEDALASLLEVTAMHVIDVADQAWVEIDFSRDVARAESLVAEGRL